DSLSSDIRVIISAYRIEKICDDHPYIWRYTARMGSVIFDHPYNAESVLKVWRYDRVVLRQR
ncbi:MAG TPA: hypothetical protein VH642_00655, partial [Streptosporangiaceae bacterium]